MKNSSPSQTSSECLKTFSQYMMPRIRCNNNQQLPSWLFFDSFNWQAHDDPPSWASVWTGYHGDVQVSFKDVSNINFVSFPISPTMNYQDQHLNTETDNWSLPSDIQLCGQEQGWPNLLWRVPYHDHSCQGDQPHFTNLDFKFLNGWWIEL